MSVRVPVGGESDNWRTLPNISQRQHRSDLQPWASKLRWRARGECNGYGVATQLPSVVDGILSSPPHRPRSPQSVQCITVNRTGARYEQHFPVTSFGCLPRVFVLEDDAGMVLEGTRNGVVVMGSRSRCIGGGSRSVRGQQECRNYL